MPRSCRLCTRAPTRLLAHCCRFSVPLGPFRAFSRIATTSTLPCRVKTLGLFPPRVSTTELYTPESSRTAPLTTFPPPRAPMTSAFCAAPRPNRLARLSLRVLRPGTPATASRRRLRPHHPRGPTPLRPHERVHPNLPGAGSVGPGRPRGRTTRLSQGRRTSHRPPSTRTNRTVGPKRLSGGPEQEVTEGRG